MGTKMKGINAYRTGLVKYLILPLQSQLKMVVKDMGSDFELYVKGNRIEMKDFVASMISDVLMAILSNLRDIDLEKINLVEIQ
jgi:hypothetical protein